MINFRYNTCNPSPSKSDHFDLDKRELSGLESELNVLTSQYDCLSVMRSLNVSRYHYDQTCVCDCHNRVEASYDTRSPIGTTVLHDGAASMLLPGSIDVSRTRRPKRSSASS
ncbi:hypothetical protein FOQG_14364 [Fusarium oxysporum f. sp. raphani 54005]|uniref:Uncharacterized protein n=2 Tax=Fusarium oxysporum TaxID=5507 RepID=X0CF46_FUSOX|nr:hypothetical protein FOVG_08879 [Fusarium oxysporum f. sp. pisi HDV247]EXK81227.1 hypothetical protein FOQG_14364 [Fusarium oxysporum f. sp. raphani 54005]KAJ4035684.1 hypothetical protein NW758_010088 [Fusarium oxysporum]KAJ4073857.1 hypothetical protein NW761_014122 [Fusarium oxysporum]KAJ4083135.1 hypothetical protein NW769_014656 [Fusarium oxysporum]